MVKSELNKDWSYEDFKKWLEGTSTKQEVVQFTNQPFLIYKITPPTVKFRTLDEIIADLSYCDYKNMWGDIKDTLAERKNDDKLRYSLVDVESIEGLIKVLEFGAKKYSPNNWQKGLTYTSIYDSLMRHMTAIMKGEDVDPESGLPHIDHVGCNWMFLSWMMRNRKDMDDRNAK